MPTVSHMGLMAPVPRPSFLRINMNKETKGCLKETITGPFIIKERDLTAIMFMKAEIRSKDTDKPGFRQNRISGGPLGK